MMNTNTPKEYTNIEALATVTGLPVSFLEKKQTA